MLASWKESYDQPRWHIEKQRNYFANKGLSSQGYGLSSSHVWMWELNNKESWSPKNWCFWTVVLENTLENLLHYNEIKPVKGNQSWMFFGRTGAEAKALIHWPSDSFEKTLILGKIEGRMRRSDRGRDGWVASPTQWTWAWVDSGSWWWTGRPGVLWFIGSQRVGQDWVTELNWTKGKLEISSECFFLKNKV